ncbi:MAG: 30S ribosomal protein S27ae [Nitrososphaerales archaeon]|nr:30S ribosomal protein S27ae [Nitrososphaerales archaeon]
MSKQQPAAPAPAPAPVPATPAAPAEEKKPEKKEKPKAPKRRIQVHKLYKVEGGSLTRLRKECPRCGRGYFMAQHNNRLTCGNCGYTTYPSKT